MLDFLTKFFRREESSKSQAKERLRLVLLSDRISLAPETFDLMKNEMLSVVQRYLDIDEQGLDFHFENAERRFMLLANIPVVNVKSSEQIEQERQRSAVGYNGVHHNGSASRRRRRRRRRAKVQTAPSNGHPPDPQ
jgi:cell division topological specificity factor